MNHGLRNHVLSIAALVFLLASSFLLIGGGAAVSGPAAPLGGTHAHPPTSTAVRALLPPTHGDLVVGPTNSPYYLTPATTGTATYFQQGNITVLPGGRLYVENLTLSFLQFIGQTGTVGGRASHLFNFTIEGLAVFSGSVLTTNTSVLNAFVKLTVNVTGGGALAADNSVLAFPGWVEVSGAASRLWANHTLVEPNPLVGSLLENATLLHDTSYAPALDVSGGARATLTQTDWREYYRNNVSLFGDAGVRLAEVVSVTVPGATNSSWTALDLPSPVAEGLALALGYPSVVAGNITIAYTSNSNVSLSGPSHLNLGSSTYALAGPIRFAQTAVNQTVFLTLPVPAGFITAVDRAGILSLLQATGEFGTPSGLGLFLGNTSAAFTVRGVYVSLTPSYSWNMVVSGGSTLTVADSTLDLTWAAVPGQPVEPGVILPSPWGSNKLLLTGGSSAYLANVSTPTAYDTAFDNQSIVIPDATSSAYVYRWGVVQAISGAFGPIPGVSVSAFSAFASTQGNNATATALNDLASTDPDLATYVALWTGAAHRTLGITDASGTAYLLLASTVLTQATLPTGLFLGSYHFGSRLAGGGPNSSAWQFGGVAPYPLAMTPASPDVLPDSQYPNYRAELSLGSVQVFADNVSLGASPVRIGQELRVEVPITNIGTAAVLNYTGAFSFIEPRPFPAVLLDPVLHFTLLNATDTVTLNFTWLVNETVIGLGGTKHVDFFLNATWNGGAAPTGGVDDQTLPMTVAPAIVSLTFNPPTAPFTVGNAYLGTGVLKFAGANPANVNVTLIGPGGTFLVGTGAYPSGSFSQQISAVPGLQSGATYTLEITAFYNGYKAFDNFTGAIHTSGTAPAAPNFFSQTIFGPITGLYLIFIIVGAIAAIAVFMFASGRLSRGKLVECGECGSLIPATAVACPQCGAEFETELVRCSRCGSTIPAASEVCPECAAQLLGSPELESKDPERQGYADFVERFRAEAKKELQDNYSEGAFWDWWKRQPSYVSFSQWKLQQSASSRAGMNAPLVSPAEEAAPVPPARKPPTGGTGAPPPATPRTPSPARPASPPPAAPAPRRPSTGGGGSAMGPAGAAAGAPTGGAGSAAAAAPAEDTAAAAAPGSGLRACSNCGKEIPTDFLVCPFCGAVTR